MLFKDCPLSYKLKMCKKRQQKKKVAKVIKEHQTAKIIGGMRTMTRKPVIPQKTFPEHICKHLDKHEQRMRIKELGQEFIWTMELDENDEVWWTPGFEEDKEEEFVQRTSKSTDLAEEASKAKETHSFEQIVPEPYRQFAKVFSNKESK